MRAQQSPDDDATPALIDRFREAVLAARRVDDPWNESPGNDPLSHARTMAAFMLDLECAVRERLATGTEWDDVYAMGLVADLAKEAGPDWTARNIPFLRELGVKLPALPEDRAIGIGPGNVVKIDAHSNLGLTPEDRASPAPQPRRDPADAVSHHRLRVEIDRVTRTMATMDVEDAFDHGYHEAANLVRERIGLERVASAHVTYEEAKPTRGAPAAIVREAFRSQGVAAVDTPATTVQDILALVSVYVRRADIEAWTPAQRELATDWAAACHAQAGDHDVTVPPRPDFLPAEQSDMPDWWFAETSDPEGARRRAKVMGMAVEGDERDVVTTTAANIREGGRAPDSPLTWLGVPITTTAAINQPPANPTALPGEIWIGESRPNGDFPPGDDIPFSKYRLKRWAEEWYEWAEKICAANQLPFEPGMSLYTVPQMRAAIGDWASAKGKVFETLDRLQTATMERDTAYVERTRLIALVAAFCHQAGLPVGLGQHDPNDAKWDPAWRTIVFVEIPDGIGGSFQASWHISDRDRELVAYLPTYDKPWDGHTTREKYLRIAAAAERLATGTGETALARWDAARRLLGALDDRGGLGLDWHDNIRKLIGARS